MSPPLSPITVGEPFHRLGINILKLPLTESGNHYLLVFVDYLTKSESLSHSGSEC